MRTLVVPELYVNITDVMDTKLKMLGCHESQRQWLADTQGLWTTDMEPCAPPTGLAACEVRPGWTYAEGFRWHSHVGFSAKDGDPLGHALGVRVGY